MGYSGVSSRRYVIGTHQHGGLGCHSAVYGVLLKAFGGVPVENEQQWAPLVNKHLILEVVSPHILMLACQDRVFAVELNHMLVEAVQLMVPEVSAIG